MILFLSVFITGNGGKYSRGHYGDFYDRLNIFKYTLASYSVIEWSHVIIYYDLDVSYEGRREELKGWINSLFINPIVYDYRLTHQSQWRKALEEVFSFEDDDLVWFCCNDDHVFIDYDTDLLYRLEAKLSALSQNYPYVACAFTHWPEYLAYSAKPSYAPASWLISSAYQEVIIEDTEEYCIVRDWKVNDSTYIVNKNWLKYLWCEVDYGDIELPRPDWAPGVRFVPTTMIIPYRELVRHYDVYTHVNIDLNLCPPLQIPDGFFENDIKILYCGQERKTGYVHINPEIENYYSHDLSGVDSRYCLEDLPLFWQNRISTIEVAQEIDRELLLSYRDSAVLKLASSMLIHYEEVNILGFAKRIKFALGVHSGVVKALYDALKDRHEIMIGKSIWYYHKTMDSQWSATRSKLKTSNAYYAAHVKILLNILGETTNKEYLDLSFPSQGNIHQSERISRVAQYCTQGWIGDLIQLGFKGIETTKQLAALAITSNRRLMIVPLDEAETQEISSIPKDFEPYKDVVDIISSCSLTPETIESIKNKKFCFAFIDSFDTYDACLTAIKTVAHCSGVVAIDNILQNSEISRAFLQGSELTHRSKLYLPLCREGYLLWP